ncbi:MAG: glycosyltransferase [Saprospiraceae bacterium]|nr:glycosyltransferase [Saprospiraceae bacterium]
MLFFSIFFLGISSVYAAVIGYFIHHWKKLLKETGPEKFQKLTCSIIIPARNEEENILSCVQSCLRQKDLQIPPEVIVVDDQSEDDTYDVLKDLEHPQFKLMRLGVYKRTTIKGSKKKALAYGINHAQGEIILTTDADCLVQEKWAGGLLAYFEQSKVQLMSGPVGIHNPQSFLDYFQALDFSGNGLINAAGIHAGTHYLCNAANLAYRKDAFLHSCAFDNNYEIASGDDIFLIEKIKLNHPDGISFAPCSDVLVETHALPGWRALISQRLRWAGKLRLMKNLKLSFLSAFVWIQRAGMFISLALVLYSDTYLSWILATATLIIPCISDFILQFHATKLYQINHWKKWFLPVWIVHNFYYLGIGLISCLPVSINWKGRKV